jgi:hypothetical protein
MLVSTSVGEKTMFRIYVGSGDSIGWSMDPKASTKAKSPAKKKVEKDKFFVYLGFEC